MRTPSTGIVEQAATARLMEETADGTGARFIHALIREAMYEGFVPSRRRRLHRGGGEALAALPDPDADAVAHHFRGDRPMRARPSGWRGRGSGRGKPSPTRPPWSGCEEAVALLDTTGRTRATAAQPPACRSPGYSGMWTSNRLIRYAEEAIKRAAGGGRPGAARRGALPPRYAIAVSPATSRAASRQLRAAVAALGALPPAAWERTATPRWYVAALDGDRSSATDVRTALAFAARRRRRAAGRRSPCSAARSDLDDAALATANVIKLLPPPPRRHLSWPARCGEAVQRRGPACLRGEEDGTRSLSDPARFPRLFTATAIDADDLALREEMAQRGGGGVDAGAGAAPLSRPSRCAPPLPAGLHRGELGCGSDVRPHAGEPLSGGSRAHGPG